MEFHIGNRIWRIVFVYTDDSHLWNGSGYTVGATSPKDSTIYLSELLSGEFLKVVLCHEIIHAWLCTLNVSIPLDHEEMLADWLGRDADNIVYLRDELIKRIV